MTRMKLRNDVDMSKTSPSPISRWNTFVTALLLLAPGVALAQDKVHLKSGETVEGKIIEETDDSLKIEVRIGSIKETKTLSKADVERVERPDPDDIAFQEIEKLVPTPSLLEASDYRNRIRLVEGFLQDHPLSEHKDAANEILDTLEEELEKVKGGALKLGGEWISGEEQRAHKENVQADILLAKIKRAGRSGAYLQALRALEKLEEDYPKTRAYVESLQVREGILKAYGRMLRSRIQERKAYNRTLEQRKDRLSPQQLAQIERAAAEQKARFERLNEREEDAGVTWLSVNMDSIESLEEAVETVVDKLSSMERIKKDELRQQAEQLYEAESLLAEGKLDEAEEKLRQAMGRSSRSRLTSRDEHVGRVIAELKQAREEKEKAAKLAELEKRRQAKAAEEEAKAVAGAEDKTEKPASAEDTLDALMAERPAAKTADQPKKEEKESERRESRPERERPSPPTGVTASTPDTGGGGLSFQAIMPIVFLLLVGVTGLLYFLDKKKKAQAGGE